MSVKCLEWLCQKHNIQVVNIQSSPDFILISSVHPETATYAERFKKYNIPIIFGGAGAYSPSHYLRYGDAVVCGDAEDFLIQLLRGVKFWEISNVMTNDSNSVEIDHNFPYDCPPIQREDHSFSVWCGRGCKKKCFFCPTGWSTKYSENPGRPDLIARRLLKQDKKISYLSNDVNQHSFYKKMPIIGHGSYSIDFIKQNGIPPARLIRLGVEGVSERLRGFVSKPISSKDLVECTSWLNQNKRGVRWFLIAGLPTETEEDWQELKEDIMTWKRLTPRGVLEISFSAFIPYPATPLGIMPIDNKYYDRFENFKTWFFKGIGFSPRVKIHNPLMPAHRLKMAMAAMDLDEKSLFSGGDWGKNQIVNYPFKKQSMQIGFDLFKQYYTSRQ